MTSPTDPTDTHDPPFAPPPAPPEGAPEADAGAAPTRRLRRSKSDRWLGGVAGGLADYFDTDPTLVRVVFVVLTLVTSGFALLFYLGAWIIMPETDQVRGAWVDSARRRGPAIGGILWGAILIIGGAAFLLAQLDLDLDVQLPPWEIALAIALVLVGLLIVVEARRGLHGGLVALALLLAVILGASRAADFDLQFDGAFGEQTVRITSIDDLDESYSHVFGSLTLDLRDLDIPEGTTAEVAVNVVFGSVDVRLPDGVPTRIAANAVFGSVEGSNLDQGGIIVDRVHTQSGYDAASRRIDLDVNAVFGSGSVR